MHVKKLLGCSALIALAASPVAVAADVTPAAGGTTAPVVSDSISVGDFLVQMARLLVPGQPPELSVDDAVVVLKEAGIAVPGDLDPARTLTEGDVVRFASAAGVRVKSANPNEFFAASKIEPLALMLGDTLPPTEGTELLPDEGQGPGPGDVGSDRAREKRKKKKTFETPSGN